MKSIYNSAQAPEPIGPYSQSVRFKDVLFVSGQIPFDQKTGQLVTESIAKETDQVMKNIEHILVEANLTFGNVLKCTIFIRDMVDFQKVNEVYAKYFKEDPPARETVAVKGLPKDVNVEISCIAGIF